MSTHCGAFKHAGKRADLLSSWRGLHPLPWSLACSDWSVTKKMQQRSVHGTSEARSEEVMQLCLTSSDAQSGVLSHYVSKLSRYAEEAQATWRSSVVGASSRGLADSCAHCRTCEILGTSCQVTPDFDSPQLRLQALYSQAKPFPMSPVGTPDPQNWQE